MATNKTLRRVSLEGAKVDLHPATVVANIYKDADENARSAFSLNLFLKETPTVGPAFMKIGPNGSITWTSDPRDLGAAVYGHSHAIGEVKLADNVTLLSDYLEDNVGGKVPLGEGNVVPDTYLPTFTQGRMVLKGTASLSAGTTPATAVNLSTIFTDFNVEPEKNLGSFYIVSVAGYVKADGITDSGTEFIDATVEGPIWMSVGDRIIFAEYISGATPQYKFALLHHDFEIATPTLAGIMSFSSLSNIENRGSLLGTSQGLAVVTEAHVRNAMRDIVYVDNVPEVTIPTAVTVLGHAYVVTAAVTEEPTHTSGTTTGAYILGLDKIIDEDVYVVFSTGRCYKAVTITNGISIDWMYISTVTVPNVPAGSLARFAGTETYMLVTRRQLPNVFVYTITDFLEGDIIIGN